ncbi:MAG: hypothetical protein R3B45_10365 [Bdellovibrionota bacterium]
MIKIINILRFFIFSLCLGLSGCLPGVLSQYQEKYANQSVSDHRVDSSDDEGQLPPKGLRSPTPPQRKTTVYAINDQTYRFELKGDAVWSAALDVLMRNYNLTTVDHKSGVITTEWDSFFLNEKVYRNKISIRISRRSWNKIDLAIVNNVEMLRDGSKDSLNSVWLPSDDKGNEVNRIIQNMALLLHQPPPVLAPGTSIAKDIDPAGSP